MTIPVISAREVHCDAPQDREVFRRIAYTDAALILFGLTKRCSRHRIKRFLDHSWHGPWLLLQANS